MSVWAPKRFWKTADVVETKEGFGVALDGKPVRTPAKAAFFVPTRALAEAVAAEWQAQGEKVDPATMPVTRAANSALDKVLPQQAEVAKLIAAYGETDLLCYRVEAPAELAARQAGGWDPLLDWAEENFAAPLRVTAGLVPITQSPEAIAALAAEVGALDPWQLTALYDLVAVTGSLVLGLAIAKGQLPAAKAWPLSRLDEEWQAQQWGRDEEADALAETKRLALLEAERFWQLQIRP